MIARAVHMSNDGIKNNLKTMGSAKPVAAKGLAAKKTAQKARKKAKPKANTKKKKKKVKNKKAKSKKQKQKEKQKEKKEHQGKTAERKKVLK